MATSSSQAEELQVPFWAMSEATGVLEEFQRIASTPTISPDEIAALFSLRLRLNTLQAPIHRVPDDLLLYIFELGFRSIGVKFSILVSHVSSRWRKLALETSILWSRLVLTFSTDLKNAPLSQVQLQRCRNAPLDVKLTGFRTAKATSHWTPILSQARTLQLPSLTVDVIPPDNPFFGGGVLGAVRDLHINVAQINSLQHFLELLACCKVLEHLVLEHLFIPAGRMTIPTTYSIDLPGLKTLAIRNDGGVGYLSLDSVLCHIDATPTLISIESEFSDIDTPPFQDSIRCTSINTLSFSAINRWTWSPHRAASFSDPSSLSAFGLIACMPMLQTVMLRDLYLPRRWTTFTFSEEPQLQSISLKRCRHLGAFKEFVQALDAYFTTHHKAIPVLHVNVSECPEISIEVQNWFDEPSSQSHILVEVL